MRTWKYSAIGVCVLVLILNAWYFLNNFAPPSWDDAWYLEMSFRFFYALKNGWKCFFEQYINAFRFKAPLISLIPLPLYALWGPSERLAVWVNEIFLSLIWFSTYRISMRLFEEKAAWAAVMATALVPLLYGLSRFFMVDCLLTCLVLLGQWRILDAKAHDRTSGVILGVILGLGLLAKSVFPLYLASSCWLCRKSLRPHAKTAVCVGGLIAGTWYVFNAPYVIGFALSAGFGDVSRNYGSHAFSMPAMAGFVEYIFVHALSWPYSIAAVGILLLAGFSLQDFKRLDFPVKFLAGWLFLPLLVVGFAVNKQIRYLAPALPAFSIFLGYAAVMGARNRKKTLLVCLMALAPLGVLVGQTLGFPVTLNMFFNAPPIRDAGWDRQAVLNVLSAHAKARGVVAVGMEHPLFNANNLASLSASQGYSFEFINLVQGQGSVEDALIRLKDKAAQYLILPQGELPAEINASSDFLNRANSGVQERVDDRRLKSVLIATVPVSAKVSMRIYEL